MLLIRKGWGKNVAKNVPAGVNPWLPHTPFAMVSGGICSRLLSKQVRIKSHSFAFYSVLVLQRKRVRGRNNHKYVHISCQGKGFVVFFSHSMKHPYQDAETPQGNSAVIQPCTTPSRSHRLLECGRAANASPDNLLSRCGCESWSFMCRFRAFICVR